MDNSTLPHDLKMSLSGQFDSQQQGQLVYDTLYEYLRLFGGFLNLSGLEAVTISDDYRGALAAVPRGFETAHVLAPTEDQFGTGMAMAVPVLREGKLKSHIVVNSLLAHPLANADHEQFKFAVHTIAHEAAHVHDHAVEAEAFPGMYGKPFGDWRESFLFNGAHMCWNEYIASRLVAHWGTESYCKEFEDTLCPMLASTVQRGNEKIDQFQSHRDVQKTAFELMNIYGGLLTRTSYLVGHIHGLDGTMEQMAPSFYKQVNETDWFTELFEAYERNVTELHQTYGDWSNADIFEPLMTTLEGLLYVGGMTIDERFSGNYYCTFTRR